MSEEKNTSTTPSAENLEVTVNKLKEEIKKLEERHSEATRKITELSQSKSTLEQRLMEVDNAKNEKEKSAQILDEVKGRARQILERATVDPESASAELAMLLQETQIKTANAVAGTILPQVQTYIKRQEYINKKRQENPDLIPHEHLISSRAEVLMREKKMSFEEAVECAINEVKPLVAKKEEKKSEDLKAPPAGARGNDGGNPPPVTAPVSQDESFDKINKDFLEERKREANKKAHLR